MPFLQVFACFRHRAERGHVESALAERPGQTRTERRIVVEYQQSAIFESRNPGSDSTDSSTLLSCSLMQVMKRIYLPSGSCPTP